MVALLGLALLSIGKGLKAFKDTGFTVKDADNIRKIITAVASAFANATSGGKDFSWWQVMWGIYAMRNLGRTLKSIAEGVQAWANLYVSEYEYNEKTGKMEEVARVKLTQQDFDNVAYGMKTVISAIAGPLAEVGKADMGASPDDPWYAAIFGGKGYVRKGVAALRGVGDVLTGLAKGVQSFANLTVSKWEMVEVTDDSGAKRMELQETERIPMTDTVLEASAKAIAKTVTHVAKPFGMIGQGFWSKLFSQAESDFPYSGDDIKRGVEALGGVGDVLSGLAKGIQDFANLTFTTYTVQTNSETGMPEVVPSDVITLTSGDFKTATNRIAEVITTIAKPFGKIGQGFWTTLFWGGGGNDFPYSASDIKRGVESLTGIGGVLTGLAEGVRAFARLEFVSNKVKNVKGVPTLVPDKVNKMSNKDITQAGKNVERVLMAIVHGVGVWADTYILNKGKKKKIEDAFKMIGTINSKTTKIAESNRS